MHAAAAYCLPRVSRSSTSVSSRSLDCLQLMNRSFALLKRCRLPELYEFIKPIKGHPKNGSKTISRVKGIERFPHSKQAGLVNHNQFNLEKATCSLQSWKSTIKRHVNRNCKRLSYLWRGNANLGAPEPRLRFCRFFIVLRWEKIHVVLRSLEIV